MLHRFPIVARTLNHPVAKCYAFQLNQFRTRPVKAYLLIALGSGLGGIARHGLSTIIAARFAGPFPWGTLIVNILGSAAIGFVLATSDSRLSPETKQFLTVGVLGGFTTFSAFSAQTMQLLHGGQSGLALVYAASSVFLCVLGCWLAWTFVHSN